MGQSSRKVIGLMSGTSLDGVDVAVLDTDGERIEEFGPTFFRPYKPEERSIINEATRAALNWNFSGVAPNIFAQAEEIVDQAHIEAVEGLLREANLDEEHVDLIGYHGQTILHRPPEAGKPGKTLQLGRGATLASKLGVDVVYDFRTHDVEQGGQGAPLAPAYHRALTKSAYMPLPTAVLNIGGVSNITVLGADGDISATDCGPGNGPLDTWIQRKGRGEYDAGGKIALAGSPDVGLVAKWLQRDFFTRPVPKSADRWDFDVLPDLSGLSTENGAATLAAFTAEAIAHTVKKCAQPIETLIVCGGGRKNKAVLAALHEQRIGKVVPAEDMHWRGDDIEAEAFAFLAVRSVLGLPLSYPGTTGVIAPLTGGRLAKALKK